MCRMRESDLQLVETQLCPANKKVVQTLQDELPAELYLSPPPYQSPHRPKTGPRLEDHQCHQDAGSCTWTSTHPHTPSLL
ncbi:MAG: hypothetical protein MPJ22_11840 [Pirellulales bacterium]|nr:hypothetical protein [Pirellulales bacterium]